MRMVHAMAWPPPDMLPGLIQSWPQADCDGLVAKYEEEATSIRNSLRSAGAWEDTSASERAFFATTLTERTTQQIIDSSWGIESVACCLWALGLFSDLPAYDTEADTKIASQLPEPGAKLRLLPLEELERARSVAELWHWRARTRQLVESNAPLPLLPGGMTLDDVVRQTAAIASGQGEIPELIDGDFPAQHKAYRDLSPEEYMRATSIASERHKALNWICGYVPKNDWDETPTDT